MAHIAKYQSGAIGHMCALYENEAMQANGYNLGPQRSMAIVAPINVLHCSTLIIPICPEANPKTYARQHSQISQSLHRSGGGRNISRTDSNQSIRVLGLQTTGQKATFEHGKSPSYLPVGGFFLSI